MNLSKLSMPAPGTVAGVEVDWSEALMKNPWLSMWLSAADTAAGAARGFWTAETRRQQNALMREAGRSSALGRSPAPKKSAASKRRKNAGR